MTDKIVIRDMMKHEIGSIIAISNAIVGKDRAISWHQSIENSLSVFPLKCLVAEEDGKIVGFLIGDTSNWEYGLPRTAWIQMVGVYKEAQGKGIGKKLLQEFGVRCKREGFKSVQALIRKDDESLRKFFSISGFNEGQLENFQLQL